MIGAAVYQIEHGTPPRARFARENVPLYIDSVYDAHFGLGQIGKQLRRGLQEARRTTVVRRGAHPGRSGRPRGDLLRSNTTVCDRT